MIRRNVGRLADYDWSFDLQVFAPQMVDAAGLAEACPKVTFFRSMPECWKTSRGRPRRLARRHGAARALSERGLEAFGTGTFIHRNDGAHIADVLDDTVAIFGAERCLFGSNFPIEKLWTSYRDLVDAYRTAAARLRPEQRDAIFATTATRVYRLGP